MLDTSLLVISVAGVADGKKSVAEAVHNVGSAAAEKVRARWRRCVLLLTFGGRLQKADPTPTTHAKRR